jgi:hypothetical protein
MKRLAPPLVLAIFAAWSGCAHIPEVNQPDPEFGFEALRKGGIANLGVVQPGEVTPPPGAQTDALEKILAIMCADVPVVRAARARGALDDSTVRFLLLSYQMHGVPEAPWLARAADSLRGVARYVALARVESNVLRYTARPAPPNVSRMVPQSDTSRVSLEGNVPVTLREIVVWVHLYDLETRRLAFSGSYFGSAVSAEHDTIPPPPQSPTQPMPSVVGKVGVLTLDVGPKDRPSGYGYPTPPPLALALEAAYLEFVRSLPGGPP